MVASRRAAALVVSTATVLVAVPAAPQLRCPATAAIRVIVDNESADATLDVMLEGRLVDAAATCAGGGNTTYAARLRCSGSGTVRCGEIVGLRPGSWVHRLVVAVSGSAPQEQRQRAVVLAGRSGEAANVVRWTVYPHVTIVAAATAEALRAALAEAAAYTATHPGRMLVTFSATAFPSASTPRRLVVAESPDCGREVCPDGVPSALCLVADRVVVDALDREGVPGAVVLSVGTCPRSVLRVSGHDSVLRGLVVEGSRNAAPAGPACQVDALTVAGPAARGVRIEQAIVLGPTCGDAISVQDGADALVVESRVTGAHDKGVKATTGGRVAVVRSCVHDNRNGGIQATLGGTAIAIDNVVQRNLPGSAQNGLSATGNGTQPTALNTDANIVRFSGGRGVSLTDDAIGVFRNDYVADNQFAGGKIESTTSGGAGARPRASFRGVAFVCNRHEGLSGTCDPTPGDVETACSTAEDCCRADDGTIDAACVGVTRCAPRSFPRGFGAVTAQAAGREAPAVDYGTPGDPGRNAFSANRNAPAGANFKVVAMGGIVAADGNQWEHCGPEAMCDAERVAAEDVVASGGAAVTIGTPPGPRAEPPVVRRVTPARPARGDLVRVFGEGFDAIDGNPLAGGDTPASCADLVPCEAGACPLGPCVDGVCPCSAVNPVVRARNRTSGANRLTLRAASGTTLVRIDPDAVTPTMLAFHMPFDCFAPLVLEVTKRSAAGETLTADIPVCDPGGCGDQPAGAPCDDGDACTADDRCDGNGQCLAGTAVDCGSACLVCDAQRGCVPRAAGTACDDADACTSADACAAGVCAGARLPPYRWEGCRLAALEPAALCGADTVPAGLARAFTTTRRKAQRLLHRAARTSPAASRRRLVRRALHLLATLDHRVTRTGSRLTPACRTVLAAALAEARGLLQGPRDHLGAVERRAPRPCLGADEREAIVRRAPVVRGWAEPARHSNTPRSFGRISARYTLRDAISTSPPLSPKCAAFDAASK